MQKDFNAFKNDPSVFNAQKVLKHAMKISAQCVYGPEISQAKAIINKYYGEI